MEQITGILVGQSHGCIITTERGGQTVARHVCEDATAQACEVRYARTIATTLKRGGWSEEEDARLTSAVVGYGESWVEVASAMPGRVNDQCRDRWKEIQTSATATVAVAAPYAKWTSEEDAKLSDAVNTHGMRWKTISLLFEGRWTDKQVYSHLHISP